MAHDIEQYNVHSGRVLDEGSDVVNVVGLSQASLGQYGGKEITGTSATTPDSGYNFMAIYAVTDIVVSAQSDVTGVTNLDLTAFTVIPAGTTLLGLWDSITLTSGQVAMYNILA